MGRILDDSSSVFLNLGLNINTNNSGDLNGDGVIDILDIIALVNMILNGSYSPIADINEDGVINILDVIIYKNIILGT